MVIPPVSVLTFVYDGIKASPFKIHMSEKQEIRHLRIIFDIRKEPAPPMPALSVSKDIFCFAIEWSYIPKNSPDILFAASD
jgi:hypothetical protein